MIILLGPALLAREEPDASAAAKAAETSHRYQQEEVAELNEAEAKAALAELDT